MRRKRNVSLLAEIVKNGLKSIMLEGRNREDFQRFLDGLAAEDIKTVRVFSDKGVTLNSTVPGEVGKQIDEQHVRNFRDLKSPSLMVRKFQ